MPSARTHVGINRASLDLGEARPGRPQCGAGPAGPRRIDTGRAERRGRISPRNEATADQHDTPLAGELSLGSTQIVDERRRLAGLRNRRNRVAIKVRD